MAHTPADYWRSYEPRTEVCTLEELLRFITDVADDQGAVVWRGVKNESWGLHSSLYRYGVEKLGRLNDDRLTRLEAWVVAEAREWGLDRVPSRRSGLELLASMQHSGSPTRLIDVSFSPLVASWFACEEHQDESGAVHDGRLFAIESGENPLIDDGCTSLPWDDVASSNYTQLREQRTSLWQPPALDPRISAQSGAFLVGPLPKKESGGAWYNSGHSGERYAADEVRALTSIPIRAYKKLTPGPVYRRNPLVSVRIAASRKVDIRHGLESVFNLRPILLFPDPYGLAGHLRRQTPVL